MQLTKFKSLNQKLIISVTFIALILALIASAVLFTFELKRATLKTEIMLNQLLDTVEGTAAIAAYSNNIYIGQDVLDGLLKNDIVHKVHIKSTFGFDLEQSKVSQNSAKEIVRELHSPFGSDQIIGQIHIQPSTEHSLAEAKHSAVSTVIISVGLIGVTALIILLMFRVYFSYPLTFVSNTLHAIKSGEKQFIPTLKKNVNDELGRLINDINNLLSVLEGKFNTEHALRKHVESIEQQLRHIFNSSSAGLLLMDEKGQLLTFNATLKEILQIPEYDENTPPSSLPMAAFFKEQLEFELLLKKALQTGQLEAQDFSLLQVTEASAVWVHCLLSRVEDASGESRIEGVLFDVSRRVENEIAIRFEAEHDPLTGLLRRQAIQTAFEAYLAATETPLISVLLMDLDGFKQVNDTYGHPAGDQVLIITAQRLSNCVRSTDIVARLGGDEFLILLINCNPPTDKLDAADNIVKSIQKPMNLDNGIIVNVGISIGIASLTQKGQEYDSIVRAADEAMYEVKRQGKNGYSFRNGDEKIVKLFRP